MAILKTSDGDVQLFVPGDIYRYDVDNRPLRNLIANDIALNTELEATTAEVVQARTGVYQTYATLDDRLDDMEIGSGLPIKQIQFHEFLARAAENATRWASGLLTPMQEIYYIRELTGENTFGAWGTSFSDYGASPFGQIILRNEETAQANRFIISNGMLINWSPVTSKYSFLSHAPVPVFLNGFHVELKNEWGGAAGGNLNLYPDEISVQLPAAPVAGLRVDFVWLEVWFQSVSRQTPNFYPYGAANSQAAPVVDPTDPSLRGNVGFHSGNGGDYFQLRHRIRVTSGVNPETDQFGMSSSLTLAQGAAGAPAVGYTFTNGTKGAFREKKDPGVWIAGAGDTQSKTDLGSIDGFVYAMPIAMVFRRNTAQWSLSNQNGSASAAGGSGSWASGVSGRPDSYYHDKIEQGDILLLAPCSVTGKTDLHRILNESFDRLLRGKLQTRHGYLRYDHLYHEDNADGLAEPEAGPVITAVNAIAPTVIAHTDQFSDVPPSGGSPAYSQMDDFRRIFGAQTESQAVGISLNLNTSTYTPSNFVNRVGNVITLTAPGIGGGNLAAIFTQVPVFWWAASAKPVVFTGSWTGVGTGTISATLKTDDTNYNATGLIVGFAQPLFGGTTAGYKKANLSTVGQKYVAPDTTETSLNTTNYVGTDRLIGPTGVALMTDGGIDYLILADEMGHKVYKVNIATGAVAASFGEYLVAGTDNTHLNQPVAVAVDAANNVYVCDNPNHRVVKLSSTLTYVAQFGVTGVSGTDNAHLAHPLGVAVDGTGNVYISDSYNVRIVKIDNTLGWVGQFGVTQVPVMDDTHCVGPRNIWFGTDTRLYVADTNRILILDASLNCVGFLQPGSGTPITRTNSAQAISPYAVSGIREDSAGNKYVLHYVDGGMAGNRVGALLTKYSSSWQFLARHGAAWDTTASAGGVDAGTVNGFVYPHTMVLDEANGAIVLMEPYNWSDPVSGSQGITPTGGVDPNQQVRTLCLKMSDLTVYSPTRWANYQYGSLLPYSPVIGDRPSSGFNGSIPYGAWWPAWTPANMEFDPATRMVYLASGGWADNNFNRNDWARVEKWYMTTPDPNTWTFQGFFGTQQLMRFGTQWVWRSWASAANDTTAFLNATGQSRGMTMLSDGSGLFLADFHSVLKLTPSAINTTGTAGYVGRVGHQAVTGSGTGYFSFVRPSPDGQVVYGIITAVGGGLADPNSRVYVSDNNNQRMVILRANTGWDGSQAAWVTTFTHPRFQTGQLFETLGTNYAGTKLWCRTWLDTVIPGVYEFNITSRDAPSFVNPAIGSTVTVFIPTNLSPLPSGVFNNISGVTGDNGTLYWTDYGTNQLVAVNLADYRFLGEAGTPGIGGNDKGNWNGPTAIAAKNDILWVADYRNSRVFSSSKYVAHVQVNVGRVEFLIAPPPTAKWFGYSKHSAYQGVYRKGKGNQTVNPAALNTIVSYLPFTGRAIIMPPEKMLVTTLGRGSVEFLKNPGIFPYANCIGRLPVPPGAPDETGVIPQDFQLSGQPISSRAHYLLPVLDISSESHGQFPGENESFYERKTMFTNTLVLGYNSDQGSRGGVQSFFSAGWAIAKPYTPLFPIVSTFGCQTIPNVRYLITPFLVVQEGEVMLAVRVQIGTGTDNEIGHASTDIVEVFRPIGHPMLKDHGESDYYVYLNP